jgi:hypothetical protein
VADDPIQICVELFDDFSGARFRGGQKSGSRAQIPNQLGERKRFAKPLPVWIRIGSRLGREVMPAYVQVGQIAQMAAQLGRAAANFRREGCEESDAQGYPTISGGRASLHTLSGYSQFDAINERVYIILRRP